MKNFLKWFFGTSLLIGGIISLLIEPRSIGTALFWIIGGLICTPPTLIIIEDKLKKKLDRGLKYLIVIIATFIGSALLNNNEKTQTTKTNSTEKEIEKDTTKNIEKELSPDEALITVLKTEIKETSKPFNGSKYHNSLDDINLELVLFSVWAKCIIEAENSQNKEVNKLGGILKKQVSKIQVQEFPKLRKAYANVAANLLWENDVDVTLGGVKNRTIGFISGVFAANKNIKVSHESLYEKLIELRFKRAEYKWYKYDDEYTYYNLSSPDDSEIVYN